MWAHPKFVILVYEVRQNPRICWVAIASILAELAEQASIHIHQDQDTVGPLLAKMDFVVHTTTLFSLKRLHDELEMLEFLRPHLLLLRRMLVRMVFQSLLLQGFLQSCVVNITGHTQLFIECWHRV